MTAPRTVADALAWARQNGLDRLEAQTLLAHALGHSRTWLLTHDDAPLPPDALALLQRRRDGEPVAYLTGVQEFHGLPLQVSPVTLVPRPDTETLVDWALDLLPPDSADAVLDLGTGSGAIALALAHRRPQARVHAVDRSPGALAVAQANGQRLGLAIDWRRGDWFAPVHGQRFALIVSNPPYIAEGDPHLDGLRHEPRSALTAGPDGLADLRTLAAQAPQHLNPGGWLLLEHGWDQADAVATLLQQAGFAAVQHRCDLAGHRRCTGGRWMG
jgi:release factor glutamine methyltransferase